MQCTAHRKSDGEPCRGKAVRGRTVCRMHGGKAGRPPVHGLYSTVLKGRFRERLRAAKDLPNPLDATEEIALVRMLLAEFLEKQEANETPISAEVRDHIALLTDHISKQVDRIIKQRNETALTVAEIKAIKAGMESLVNEFVPADRRRDFVSRLRALIPG